jgi:hypothetical protein
MVDNRGKVKQVNAETGIVEASYRNDVHVERLGVT